MPRPAALIQASGATEKGLHLENQDASLIDQERGLFAVADGVTISKDGGKASRMAISLLRQRFAGKLERLFPLIDQEVRRRCGGGTTTLTAAFLNRQQLLVCHVGDSSLHVAGPSGSRKITEDDVAEGSNLLVQAIGSGKTRPHLSTLLLRRGEAIVLMTDGVGKHVTPQEIAAALRGRLKDAPAALIAAARKKRKLYEDDKTVVVARA